MAQRYYHTPPPPVSTRLRCPVCHEAVYSRAGIHPQCAARQAERPEPRVKAVGFPGGFEPGRQAVEPVGGVAVVGLPTADGASAADRLSAADPPVLSP
jgi:hypothetical protein